MGGMNYHIELRFDDGVKWIARIRRFNATSPPAELRDHIIQREVATLKFLEQTSAPTPKVFDFTLDHADNPVGVGYILMEKLPGKPLLEVSRTKEQMKRVMEQLADVFIELHKYPFNRLGSLDNPGDSHVGALARESLTDFIQSEMRTMGPFSSMEEYHKSSLQLLLDQILRQEMYSNRAVDAYLIHRFLLDLVPSVLSSAQDDGKFYLKHADDKGDHILVDENFNITGIIDWEWAHTAPLSHAFNSPLAIFDVAEFYNGVNNLSDNETVFARIFGGKGHQDLADSVWKGRLQHRFNFCCGHNLEDWSGFLGLFQGLRNAVKVDDGMDWDGWKIAALDRYKDDAGLQLLLRRKGNT
ncbi:kinase-like domain-containing protein [Annulohypoxylon maeteangense]|uniref:kinase-like domain-containing protein n=1 Tax=Annulohypoxylon maeteangense TaxID=1927788 RepID=UPI002007E8A2|nr:kinase-like domain-containing protein [Annulohypoxylon maeteangense]KAI0882820.1 kinase-like domain-containing protein [Annulohypoxylon maeteangense]